MSKHSNRAKFKQKVKRETTLSAKMPRKSKNRGLSSVTKGQKKYRASQKASQGTDSKDLGGFQSCKVSAILFFTSRISHT